MEDPKTSGPNSLGLGSFFLPDIKAPFVRPRACNFNSVLVVEISVENGLLYLFLAEGKRPVTVAATAMKSNEPRQVRTVNAILKQF